MFEGRGVGWGESGGVVGLEQLRRSAPEVEWGGGGGAGGDNKGLESVNIKGVGQSLSFVLHVAFAKQ